MAVQDPSELYLKMHSLQKKCRDCIDGQQTIHDAGTLYLQRLEGDESDNDVKNAYNSYKGRALFYNTVGRTKTFFKGLILRIPPKIIFELDNEDIEDKKDKKNILEKTISSIKNRKNKNRDSNKIKYLKDDVTGTGINFWNFCSLVINEILSVGWGAVFVDYDKVPEELKTKAETDNKGLRAKLKFYPAESILGTEKTIRLLEEEDIWIDEFTKTIRKQVRVLDLDEKGFYRQRVYVEPLENDKDDMWIQVGDSYYPTIGGKKMKYIPFYPCGADINSMDISKPPLIDLADVSIQHYGVYADYRNGIHFTGFPQLYTSGHASKGSKLRMGSGLAWQFEEPNASAKYAEFNGRGLDHPERLLKRLEDYMSKLGARMLTTEKQAAESEGKVKHDSASESSVLANIALNCADAITSGMNVLIKWEGIPVNDIVVELNTDYQVSTINPSLVIALMKAVQANYMTKETFLYNMKKGELIPNDRSIQDELKEINKVEEKVRLMLLKGTGNNDDNPLSERNKSGLKDPSDELRDVTRSKTDYDV